MRHFSKLLSLSSAVFFLSAPALAQTIFIEDATVVTNERQGKIEGANIVVKDGKITQLGKNVKAPNGADQ